MTELERLQKKINDSGLSPYRLAQLTGLSQSAIGKILKGKVTRPNYTTISTLNNFFSNQKDYKRKLVEMDSLKGSAQKIGDNEFLLVNNTKIMVVPFINQDAQVDFIGNYDVKEFLDDLPKYALPVDSYPKGKYFAFEMAGDSMDDGTKESIQHGSIVMAREIQKSLWSSRPYLAQFKYFVVVSNGGIMTKKITDIDPDSKSISFSSLNPDKDKFPDVLVPVDEIKMILNIINICVSN